MVWVSLRYSSEQQTIESQEHVLREWCAQHRLVIGQLFKDEAITGKRDAGRKQFLEMIRLLEHGLAQPAPRGVLFWSFAREARNVVDAEYYKWLLRKKGFVVFTLADEIPQGELAPVFEAWTHIKDAEYVKRLSDEVRRGLEFRIAKGVPHTAHARIGYRLGEKVYLGPKMRRVNGVMKQVGERWGQKLEKDPGTRARVELAWQMALAGRPDYEIHQATQVRSEERRVRERV